MTLSKVGRLPAHILSLLVLVALWQAASVAAGSRLLPGPAAVAARLMDEVVRGGLLLDLAITLGRVCASFVIAMAVGTALGIAMGRFRLLDRLLDGWLVLFLNIPALVTIILAYVWFGLTESAAIAAVAVNKIPNVVVTLREGARALDRDYMEMAEAYRLGPAKTLRHVVLPQLYPFLLAAARSGLALIWKIVLVVELLGRSNGMGFQLQVLFQLFDVTGILAYTAAFIIVVQFIEFALLQPLETRASRWRR
ncbi:ABC transporter permease [Skermanella mucosa]|uniref:ABC transporter permease n=1 Tax=Skermanella mucosa TaxID=1789672 RepID=UPI00192ADEA5|nr:ABC transporter permease [Skermanella mucosa]UEM19265.1 ABC transporter permease [Skermanella mucosa]